MKHTEEYLQAKWVTKNPDGYDERDVVDAKRYCNAYLDGYNQALRTPDIVGQSEQLVAFLKWVGDGYDFENNAEKIVKEYIDEYNYRLV